MSRSPLIAIIEDDDSLRDAVAGLVESMGHEAIAYASAEAFLSAGTAPDCIVTDITLPGLSGIELKQALDAADARAPVIMITARPEETVLERARASGALCVLRKPFTPAALIDCLERALASRDTTA